ncbi:MAG TPA: T9SS type A sorting domain-containing protein [Chitinophagaceae bacterium]|nr:T9SS type A sorting domain-containing protein [Chitinophagaceae bacterium]
MKKILLLLVMISVITGVSAQKRKKTEQPLTGYAITAVEKGGRSWKEVRLVNITTGEEIKSIYQSKQEIEAFNARTGNPVVKKDMNVAKAPVKKIVNLDQELAAANGSNVKVRTVVINNSGNQYDKPFATNSAAMAYDKKHERLYYTPMGFNQLRYIDLKSNKIYYFENEPFGAVSSPGDGANQICRMVIASDGNGYALTNDANHLIRFTTGKDPVITDLGALTDDAGNANYSVHSRKGYGGDMIADASGNLYVLTANRNVFKVSIESKAATYQGTIKGLPDGFTTNGAMVEDGSKVIVASSESAIGYYRFDLTTMQAEKVSTTESVFNASDLANERLAFAKKKKDKKNAEEPKQQVTEEVTKKSLVQNAIINNGISVYPNPVTNGLVKVSFADQPAGKYSVDLIDITGKLIQTKEVNVNSSMHIEEIRIAKSLSGGSYLLKINGVNNNVSVTNKIVIQ